MSRPRQVRQPGHQTPPGPGVHISHRARLLLSVALLVSSGWQAWSQARPAVAQGTPPQIPVSGLTRGHVHVMPYGAGGHPWLAPAQRNRPLHPASAPAGAHLNYYGGPVMQQGHFYTIFWQPSGWHFEAAFDGNAPTSADARYEGLINRFFTDLGGTTYYNILTQYSDAASIGGGTSPGPTIQNVADLAGTTVDTTAFPSGTVCGGAGIDDTQLQAEVASVATARGWTVDDNHEFVVYTPVGLNIEQGGSCSGQAGGFCAYHGTAQTGGQTYIYAAMFDTNVDPGCGATSGPNGDNWADQEIGVTSHEMAESVTDAYVGLATANAAPLAWYDFTNGEIGDICNAFDTTVQLGSDTYVVQWSQATWTVRGSARACSVRHSC